MTAARARRILQTLYFVSAARLPEPDLRPRSAKAPGKARARTRPGPAGSRESGPGHLERGTLTARRRLLILWLELQGTHWPAGMPHESADHRGAGFIGSTIASAFTERGATPVVLDSLITGRREFADGKVFYQGDIGDGDLVDEIFRDHPDIALTVHCAALIVVPDSMTDPLRYYRVNLSRTLDLAGHLVRNGCDRMIFASTAGMYRPEADLSVTETSELEPQNPYTRSKMMAELLLRDFCEAYGLRVISLRYLNPIGADPRLRTGLQNSKPTHALGKMIECYATGVPFKITGVDWETRDGTAIRDYIHVWDIARAFHAAAARFDAIIPPLATTPATR
ncbi:NAD-dependent epimerase/dehydratase family protein [Actinomadura luteofluorescens]|uniref:NAD-dependent epimerase/dehydratase family protein n=1 Tax=Actinomadura luteofluorescens TaxID=46163 RepID=UPI0036250A68